jgi:hypothetical protein
MSPLRLLRPASAMPMLSLHPRLDALSDLLARHRGVDSVRDTRRRARIAAHVARCAHCQASLRFLRTLDALPLETSDAHPSLPPELLSRVLRSRAAGERVLLPPADALPVAPRRRWALAAVAAVLLAIAGIGLAWRGEGVEAGTTSGALEVTPAAPTRGEPLSIRYRPAARLSGQPWLALRARLRSAAGEAFELGLPIETIARLRPTSDGTYTATVTLPDSVVFAALAVEDSAGTVLDDNGDRVWEVLVTASDGRPLFAALDQRANDLMGRDRGEGFETARRLVALYPDSVRSWARLLSHQRRLGRAQDDTVQRLHRARVAAFDARLRREAHPAGEAMGRLAAYAADVDSATSAYWSARVLREAPASAFAVPLRQRALRDTLRATRDTARTLAGLDALWREAPADRRPSIVLSAFGMALGRPDGAATLRWAERQVTGDRDPLGAALYVTRRLADEPSLRAEGMAWLRRLIARLDSVPPAERGLTNTVAVQRETYAGMQRLALASLGRALVADGRTAAALDTLARAAATGWDIEAFRAVREASLEAGDSSTARRMAARIAVDPRADAAFVDSARRALPEAALDSARAELVARVVGDAPVRALRGEVTLRDASGRPHDLRELARGHVTVVAVWSRCCGVALNDLPRLQAATGRLVRSGVRVVSVVYDERASSPALEAMLKEQHVRLPTYFDGTFAVNRAFDGWSVPAYYVLDPEGKVWFERANRADQVLVQAEALRLSVAPRTAGVSVAR